MRVGEVGLSAHGGGTTVEFLQQLMSRAIVFRNLTERDRAELARSALHCQWDPGAVLAWAGDTFPYALLIEEGSLQPTSTSPDGRTIIMRTWRPGEVFWGHTIIDGGPVPCTLTIAEPTSAYRWHKDYILPITKSNREALWDLSLALMRRMREASSSVMELAFDDVETRLARLLIDEFGDDIVSIRRTMTLDEMAARIKTSREVVCRLLQRLDKKEMIEVTRTELSLKDPEALRTLASKLI